MHTRITRTLLAVSVAGVTAATLGFTSAGAASAASAASLHTAPPIYTSAYCYHNAPSCAMSGYQDSGQDFQSVQASITVPTGRDIDSTSPHIYVGLSDVTGGFARAGIDPCTPGIDDRTCSRSGWEAYFELYQPQLGLPPDTFTHFVPVNGAYPGETVAFSISVNAAGNSDRFTETLPWGNVVTQSTAVNGPIYSTAVAVADWTGVNANPAPVFELGPKAKLLTTFSQGAITTSSGQQGTFAGPWSTVPVEVTSNGHHGPIDDSGALISEPSDLSTDGSSFGVWLEVGLS
jgi:hypothetical protein